MLLRNIHVCLVPSGIDNVSGQKCQIWLTQMFQTQVGKSPPNNPESVTEGFNFNDIFPTRGSFIMRRWFFHESFKPGSFLINP